VISLLRLLESFNGMGRRSTWRQWYRYTWEGWVWTAVNLLICYRSLEI